ncbi:MAG: hypothetical protein ACRD1R_10180 [Acidobacteriota bacterium]
MTIVHILNTILSTLFDLLFRPFRGFDPVWALVFVSLLTGILMVWVFGKVSNQEGIRQKKNKIRGNLLGVRLYQHDVAVVLRLQRRIFRDTLSYMGYSLAPMLALIIPLLLIIAQLNLYFSARPFQAGEQALVKARFDGIALMTQPISLKSSGGVTVETPPVRIDSQSEVAWRVRAQEAGHHRLAVQVGETTVDKGFYVEEGWGPAPGLRTSSALDLLLYPGEAPLDPDQNLKSIEVSYRPLPLAIWGWEIHWLVLFFVLSMIFAFAFKGVFGVEL